MSISYILFGKLHPVKYHPTMTHSGLNLSQLFKVSWNSRLFITINKSVHKEDKIIRP